MNFIFLDMDGNAIFYDLLSYLVSLLLSSPIHQLLLPLTYWEKSHTNDFFLKRSSTKVSTATYSMNSITANLEIVHIRIIIDCWTFAIYCERHEEDCSRKRIHAVEPNVTNVDLFYLTLPVCIIVEFVIANYNWKLSNKFVRHTNVLSPVKISYAERVSLLSGCGRSVRIQRDRTHTHTPSRLLLSIHVLQKQRKTKLLLWFAFHSLDMYECDAEKVRNQSVKFVFSLAYVRLRDMISCELPIGNEISYGFWSNDSAINQMNRSPN